MRLDNPTLKRVRQRQVGQHPVVRMCFEILTNPPAAFVHGIETHHGAFGIAGTARGVNDGGRLFRGPLYRFGQRFVFCDNVVPLRMIVFGRKGKGDHGKIFGYALFQLIPDRIELADKKQLRLRMHERVLDNVGGQNRKNRNTDMPRHPDGQVGDDPPGAILRTQGDVAAIRQIETLEVGGHTPGFINCFFPGPGPDVGVAAPHRLREIHPVRCAFLPVISTFQ